MASMAKTTGWVVWCLSLLACPSAILILGQSYYQPPSPESFLRAPPWPWYAMPILFWCQVGISLMAAVAVFRMASGQQRQLAWLGVLVLLAVTALAAFAASGAVSGRYL